MPPVNRPPLSPDQQAAFEAGYGSELAPISPPKRKPDCHSQEHHPKRTKTTTPAEASTRSKAMSQRLDSKQVMTSSKETNEDVTSTQQEDMVDVARKGPRDEIPEDAANTWPKEATAVVPEDAIEASLNTSVSATESDAAKLPSAQDVIENLFKATLNHFPNDAPSATRPDTVELLKKTAHDVLEGLMKAVFSHAPSDAPDATNPETEKLPKETARDIFQGLVKSVQSHLRYDTPSARFSILDAETQADAERKRWAITVANDRIRRCKQFTDPHMDLRQQWDLVLVLIEGFCEGSLNGFPWDWLDESMQAKFTGWAPNARKLFHHPDGFESGYFFAAWMWRILCQHVFSADKSHELIEWLSPYYAQHEGMKQYLRNTGSCMPPKEALEIWHHWEYATTALFFVALNDGGAKADDKSKKRMEPSCIVRILQQEMGEYFPKVLSEHCWGMLEQLGPAVSALEMTMSSSMMDVRFKFRHPVTEEMHGFPYHEGQLMKAVTWDPSYPGRPVELILSPLVQTRGIEGVDYRNFGNSQPMRIVVETDLPEDDTEDEEVEEEEDVADAIAKKDSALETAAYEQDAQD